MRASSWKRPNLASACTNCGAIARRECAVEQATGQLSPSVLVDDVHRVCLGAGGPEAVGRLIHVDAGLQSILEDVGSRQRKVPPNSLVFYVPPSRPVRDKHGTSGQHRLNDCVSVALAKRG